MAAKTIDQRIKELQAKKEKAEKLKEARAAIEKAKATIKSLRNK
jgi:hypothetical protein